MPARNHSRSWIVRVSLASVLATVLAPTVILAAPASLTPRDEAPVTSTMRQLPQQVKPRGSAALYATAEGDARVGKLAAGTALAVRGAQGWRLEVQCVTADACPDAQAGWVSLDDVQPAPDEPVDPPLARLPDRRAFVEMLGAAARSSKAQTGVPAAITVAQAILESGWGESQLARRANNYFGIKGVGSDGVVWMPTTEYVEQTVLVDTVEEIETVELVEVPIETDAAADEVVEGVVEETTDEAVEEGVADDEGADPEAEPAEPAPVVKTRTVERVVVAKVVRQVPTTVLAPVEMIEPFRAYRTLADSLADQNALFRRLPRYQAALEVPDDAAEFARRIAAAGYSTDPAYADKLIALMDQFDLYRFDTPVPPVDAGGAGYGWYWSMGPIPF